MLVYILLRTLDTVYGIINLALLARAIMSWIVRDYTHPIPHFIYIFTEPILTPMRKLFDKYNLNTGPFDFSFLATFFALRIIYRILLTLISSFLFI